MRNSIVRAALWHYLCSVNLFILYKPRRNGRTLELLSSWFTSKLSQGIKLMKTWLLCFPCDMQNKMNTVITVALSVFPRAKENLVLLDQEKVWAEHKMTVRGNSVFGSYTENKNYSPYNTMICSNMLLPWYSCILHHFCWRLLYELKSKSSLHVCLHNWKNNLSAASSCIGIISEAWLSVAIWF